MMNSNSSLERQLRTLRKRSTFTLFLTWLALFFTVVGIAAGYKNFLRVHDKAKAAQEMALQFSNIAPAFATKSEVDSWQQGISKKLEKTNAQASAELSELKAVKESNEFITEALSKQAQQMTIQQNSQQQAVAPSQQWKANEARYLLQVASRKLLLDQDIEAAQQALVLADQALAQAAMPRLLTVRAQIAKDIVLLNSYQPVDLADVVEKIGNLSESLRPQDSDIPAEASIRKLLKVTETDGRNSMINRVKESINNAVVIRTYDEKLAKKITGDTDTVRYALLQLKLEGLKLLALKHQQTAYDLQLTQIIEQLENDHTTSLSSTQKESFDELKSLTLIARVPVIVSTDMLGTLLLDKSEAAQ
ncbi:uroporphyrinogen-III C-methyltransferase [Leucothrix arctica]|uniref:Uncharacterized protein n=1 Tax=Leucothrix arctica TaxID=1481894 RepID=A0A317CSF4_9GAMM|nr:uroporphyrinogen-III C-methyltransferase [Leucothrix arctica]PWQ99370.1 hypothetical protein DKT75_01340 [Leucothrix arctica]